MTYLAELEAISQASKQKISQIKLVAFDVDGVLTNGQLHYQAEGEVTKVFHVRDGVGLKLLTDMGISVAVISAKKSAMVAQRMQELGIRHYFPGTKDKLQAMVELSEALGLKLSECCFVGDDMVDLKPMTEVGLSISPTDAYPLVAEAADICLPVAGGQGVARWVADVILHGQGLFESAYQLSTSALFERNRS